MKSIIKEFLIYSTMSKLHSSVDPNSLKNIITRLGLGFPGKNWDDLEYIATEIITGRIIEEDVTWEMVQQSMEMHRINNPNMYAEKNAEELFLDLVKGKKIEIKVWMGIVKDLDLNCPGLSLDPQLPVEGIDTDFDNVKENVTEIIEVYFTHMAKDNDKIIDTENIVITFNKTQEEFNIERATINEDNIEYDEIY
ncbi:MAG: hypothetical protein HeimC2_21800 [Candidatus Heimdallarchaeota archaeon LC_2]|nr:MAG: hypothetical protein HeimC2_21800 [Candidatus Heimdallarchaeota archaeon LC_2]